MFSDGGKLMALVKYEYYETGDYFGWVISKDKGADKFDKGQTFTPLVTHYLEKIELLLHRVGVVDEVTVEIRPTSSDVPLGDDSAYGEALASVTVDVSGITTDTAGEWVAFTLSTPVQLTVGVKYAVVAASNVYGGSTYVVWNAHLTGTYTRGSACFYSTSWTTNVSGTYDFAFRDWGKLTIAANQPPANVTYTKKLVAVGANEVWYESSAGTMEELTDANDDIDVTKGLDIFELFSKVFVVNDTNLKVADFVNTKIETDDIKDEAAGATSYPKHGTLITGAGGAKMVVDYITALDSAAVIYGKKIGTTVFVDGELVSGINSDDSTVVKLDIKGGTTETAGPFWYNWAVYGANAAGYGALPNKATLGCNYRGRAVISGDEEYSHQWYMMRQGHPFDALYAGQDAQSAVAGNNADAGEIGDIITALIPCNDDYLIFGCGDSIWFLAGDPCDGGSINELDLTTGIYGAKSWCHDGEGNLYFWGANGLYRTTIPGKPVCISEIKLPDLINDEAVDRSTHRVVLVYDRDRAGILICITKISDGTNSNYWYDLRTNGFFPETYPTTKAVYSAFYYEAVSPTYRKLLLGCYDGYLRIFDKTSENDDDTLIDSYVTFAPMPMSNDPKFTGKLTGLMIETAGGATGGSESDSDDIYFKIWVANVAQQIIEKLSAGSNPKISGTITAPGRQRGSNIKQKVKGVYMGIKIGNDTVDETWAFEQLLYDLKRAGRLK